MNTGSNYFKKMQDMILKNILFYIKKEDVDWYKTVTVRPIRILRLVDEFIAEAIKEIQIDIRNDKLIATFKRYEEIIQLLKEHPTYVIVESVDFSHGYEYSATIEDESSDKFFIAPFWDSHEIEYLIKSNLFKKIDTHTSEDETLTTRKFKLK